MEKAEILKQYTAVNLTIVLFQNGTKSTLVEKKTLMKCFSTTLNLLKLFRKSSNLTNWSSSRYHQPKNTHNEALNDRTIQLIEKQSNFTNNFRNFFVIVQAIHERMTSLPKYNSFLYDDIHFGYNYGVHCLKTNILSFLLMISHIVTFNYQKKF